MHPTAMENGKIFFETYVPTSSSSIEVTVVDIGSQDVNGSLKEVCQNSLKYIGVDSVSGKGVDIVLDDPYKLPFAENSVDIVVSSSCFEHSEMFWVLFLEIMRVLKPEGLFYLNAPSNGVFHRYPVDCWRFYPDSGNALVSWAKRNGYSPSLLESYISTQIVDFWNDFVAIYVKDEAFASKHKNRILHSKKDVYNAYLSGRPDVINLSELTEDQKKLAVMKSIINNQIKIM